MSNLAGMPNSRPGTASGNAPTIDVLSQEVEEMELHEQSERENEAQHRGFVANGALHAPACNAG